MAGGSTYASPRRALRRRATLLVSVGLLACGPAQTPGPAADEVPVHVGRIGLDARDRAVVILEESAGHRWLAIWIGDAEARSIDRVMSQRHASRPNTHDLTRRVIEELEAEVVRVVVTELRDDTFYATLTLRVGDDTHRIDARPSESIAIALRTDAPIYVREALFEADDGELSPSDEPAGPQLPI